ncbi:ABC transporter permease [Haliangium sp.]|uniref:ABC transporter permease n=1 Tax=Haliangium sp. TaxID=2663208 RepID=UPI003D12D6F3
MSLGKGVLAQLDVVHALVLRETRTRFGAHQLGYLWAFLEPAIWIGTFYTLYSIAGRQPPDGMDLISFLVTGMVPYELFLSTNGRVSVSINSNKALLFYPQVNPLDLTIARVVLEATTSVTVFTMFMLGVMLFHQHVPTIDDALRVVLGFALAAGLGAGLGQIFCAAGVFTNVVDRIRGPLIRPLFWCSGLFYTANGLPDSVREVFMYNPLFHAIELVRDGWFPAYQAHHASTTYAFGWLISLALLGLVLERVVRRRIEVT